MTALISAYTGMGDRRRAAAAHSASPAAREPVKPTAMTFGSLTSAAPSVGPSPYSSANTPAGSPHSAAAATIARATSSDVPGCASCALTMTGQPAANADAVSPPATEKASGKLLAANTATGPSGTIRWRMSGRGTGARSGWPGSIRAPFQLPSRSTSANNRNCAAVRTTSPAIRACGSPDSSTARSTSSSPKAINPSAMASRKRARCSALVWRKTPNAAEATSPACRSASASP